MNEHAVTTNDSTRRITLTVVIEYSGEPCVAPMLELEVMTCLLGQIGNLVPDIDLDERTNTIMVDTVSDTRIMWDFDECPYCAARGTSECETEYCVVRGKTNEGAC